jgi:aryl-alcohol dehydrogenase-like predicted oxidoreductase
VSQIAFGGATFGREIDGPTAWRLMDRALERGINLLDTAEAYSNRESERIIGRWLADRKNRQEIILATKCYGKLNGAIITEKIDQSLQCLQTDWIDLFQIHHFPHDGDPLDEILESLDRAVQAGKVRHLGLSNCAAWQFCKALWRQDRSGWARFESMQPSYSLVERSIIGDAPAVQGPGRGHHFLRSHRLGIPGRQVLQGRTHPRRHPVRRGSRPPGRLLQ